jgi:hypothetical protein
MSDQANASRSTPGHGISLWAAIALAVAVSACAVYANLSLRVKNPATYRFFPPFQRGYDANDNKHLGAEYFNIAKALVAGQGYANPFPERTGPTAWMPPVLPFLLAGLLWLCDGNKDAVMTVVIFLQVWVLIGTGLLVLALARQTTTRVWAGTAASVFFLGLLCNFHLWFQFTHDCWLILLAIDLLIAGLCWLRPLASKQAAAGWGLFGGLCALINPMVALAWGVLTLPIAFRQRTWTRLAWAVLVAGLTLCPWAVRNYRVFGRLIPVKSNLAFELYQSQCLQTDGLIRGETFTKHPIANASGSRREYKTLGEIAFVEEKGKKFWAAVRADPVDFLDRVASRFLGATLWYVPLDRTEEAKRPWVFWLSRLAFPLPFLGLLVLAFTAFRQPLHRAQWVVIGVYLLYLGPYIVVSYYERYAVPLVGVKALLVIWAADRLLSFLPTRRTKSGQKGRALRPERTEKPRKAVPSTR